MNGLNLAQLPAQAQTQDELDPMKILEDQRKRAIQQLESDVAQQQQLITRKSNNQLNILQRRYKIEAESLVNRYERGAKTKEELQRHYDELMKMNTRYSMQAEQIQGKVQPDLQDLEMAKQQQLQQLQKQQEEVLVRFSELDEAVANGIITDPVFAVKRKLQLLGHEAGQLPITAFKPKSIGDMLSEIMDKKMVAILSGDVEAEQRLEQEQEILFRQVSPDIATAYRKADRLSGLETRRKRKRGVEEPGTFAEGIIEAKNKKINVPALRGLAHPKMLTEREKPISKVQYMKHPQTGERYISYDGGETWQPARS